MGKIPSVMIMSLRRAAAACGRFRTTFRKGPRAENTGIFRNSPDERLRAFSRAASAKAGAAGHRQPRRRHHLGVRAAAGRRPRPDHRRIWGIQALAACGQTHEIRG
jgi:hypothetical protein